jgi:putative glutamine amidotransferase
VGPRIGISTYARAGERPAFAVPCSYVDAVRDGGGLPVLLPPLLPPQEIVEAVDAMLLPGGGDVAPVHYGGTAHAENYDVCDERDAFELGLVRAAVERELPLLCICRGMQVLNVALGGDLITHLPDHVGEDVPHRGPGLEATAHEVRLDAGTRVRAVHDVATMAVQSIHHQAVARLGADLRATAWSPDGVVEALESDRHGFVLAVQWHPELDLPGTTPRRAFAALAAQGERYAARFRRRGLRRRAGAAPRRARP